MYSININDLNIYCKNKGWLFEDIKDVYSQIGVVASDEPVHDAKGWICVRSTEILRVPRLDRAVVQVHDLADHDMEIYRHVAGVSFTHPVQHWAWQRRGFVGRYLIRPIGSRRGVNIPDALPIRPTIGFFCGEGRDLRKGANVFERAVLLARERVDFDCLLIGRALKPFAYLGTYEERAAGIHDYARIDALFCASVSPAVPLSVYEAQSAGKIVITTPRWMPGGIWPGMKYGENVNQLANRIVNVINNREKYFDKRATLRRTPYVFDDWVSQNLEFTLASIKATIPR